MSTLKSIMSIVQIALVFTLVAIAFYVGMLLAIPALITVLVVVAYKFHTLQNSISS